MKVALCLHGNFNSNYDNHSKGIDGFKYIEKHILKKFNTDVFIHSWDLKNKKRIIKLYKPKKAIFQSQIDFDDHVKKNELNRLSLSNQPRPPQIVFSHIYSVDQVLNLCFNYNKKYDMIIKARFDLGRINRKTTSPLISLYSFIRGNGWIYPVQCIKFPKSLNYDKLYVAFWKKFNDGPADMWYYGSEKVMKKFSNLFKELNRELKRNSEFLSYCEENSEGKLIFSDAIKFYKYYMLKYEIWNKIEPLKTKWT